MYIAQAFAVFSSANFQRSSVLAPFGANGCIVYQSAHAHARGKMNFFQKSVIASQKDDNSVKNCNIFWCRSQGSGVRGQGSGVGERSWRRSGVRFWHLMQSPVCVARTAKFTWATESEVVSPERSEPRSGRYAGCALAIFRKAEHGRERCPKTHPARAANEQSAIIDLLLPIRMERLARRGAFRRRPSPLTQWRQRSLTMSLHHPQCEEDQSRMQPYSLVWEKDQHAKQQTKRQWQTRPQQA